MDNVCNRSLFSIPSIYCFLATFYRCSLTHRTSQTGKNGKTGSRPSRLVGNFPHFHAPAFTQRSHRNLGLVDSSQVSRFFLIVRGVRVDDIFHRCNLTHTSHESDSDWYVISLKNLREGQICVHCQNSRKIPAVGVVILESMNFVYVCVYLFFQSPLGHTVPSHKDLPGFKYI